MAYTDPYNHTSCVPKLRDSRTIFLTDLDGTHATKEASFKELGDRAAVRKFVDDRNFVSVAVTARTPALTMSHSTFLASQKLGFNEAEPHCGMDKDGRRIYVPPEELPQFAHSLDWDAILGFGSGVFPRNGHGYLVDREFDNLLNYDHEKGKKDVKFYEPIPWRTAALAFLAAVAPDLERTNYARIEFSKNYHEGKVDVMPLPYRIQLHFEGAKGLARMRKLVGDIRNRRNEGDPLALRLAIVDESKPRESVEESTYTIYLLPWAARKERMINRFIPKVTAAANLDQVQNRLFYAGDTPTDLRAGLYAGGYVPLTFLLATGSPLARYLLEQRRSFGEESLSFLWESDWRAQPKLIETAQPGVYTCKVPTRRWTNTVVIGDVVYPNMTPPGSVRAFLEEFAKPNTGP